MQKRILNVGCGQGAKTRELAKLGEVIGIDISEKALELARKNFPNSTFIKMNAEKMDFPDRYFDEVHCYDVLEHVNNLNSTMKEIARVIKQDGILVAEVPYVPSEQILVKLNKSYFKEAHHKRTFPLKKAYLIFNKNGFFIRSVIGKKFIENLYLIHFFKAGSHVLNQQGELSKIARRDELDETFACINLLAQQPLETSRYILNEKEIKLIEEKFDLEIKHLAILITLLDVYGSRFFPKTLRFECIYTGKKEKQEPKLFQLEPIPKNFSEFLKDFASEELKTELKEKQKNLEEKEKHIKALQREVLIREEQLREILNSSGYKMLTRVREIKKKLTG